MAKDIGRFVAAMKQGQHLLGAIPAAMEAISGAMARFGWAVSEFGSGRIGVACVTRDGQKAIEGDFLPGVPLSIVLVDHAEPETPMPIVGEILVSQHGFPVEVTAGNRSMIAHDAETLDLALCELAMSVPFAAAVADATSRALPQRHLQS